MAEEKDALQLYSTQEVAKLLGVDATTVILWCKNGKLGAYKTPGGHRRIKAKDLLAFVKKFNLPIPKILEKTDQKRILIVDDDPQIRILTKRIILSFDPSVNIEMAEDGFEAGKKASDLLPDLIILDLNIPGINGIRVCENLKRDDRFRSTKVLAITGEVSKENKEKFLKAGANSFLPKPFDDQILEKKIKKLIY